MKKLVKILLFAALVLPVLVSCNKDDEPKKSVLGTILPYFNEVGFAIQLDNGESMYPSRVHVNYQPKESAQRAIIYFTENNTPAAPFTYNVNIHGITEIETKEIELVSSSEEELSNDGIEIVEAYIGGGYINIEFKVNIDPYQKNQKHIVSLVDNQIGGEPKYDGYYPLELRFKRDHSLMDGKGQTVSNLVCFYIGSYNIDRLGCNGYEIKFTGLDSETNKDPEGKPMKSVKISPIADMK